MSEGGSRFRMGRGRSPDPQRPGTIYRAGPHLRRRGLSNGPPYVGGQAPQAGGQPPADQDEYSDRYARYADEYADQQQRYGGDQYPGPGYDDPYGEPPPPPPGVPYGRPGRRPRRPRLRLRLLILLLVLALVAYPILLGMTAWTNLGRVDAIAAAHATKEPPADTPGRTYLVVGSDSRDNLTPEERKRLGTGKVAGRRTDTIMMLHVPSSGGPTVLISVPRDSYVNIPGRGRNKINAAYAFGGPALLVRTLEGASGLRIDDYVETGLAGFANIVDAVGGVRLCPKRAINDKDAHINVPKGCQDMDGKTALGYARARKSDPRGDLGRVERQREVLAAIASKTLSPATMAQPWRAFPAAKSGGGALAVDENTSPWGVTRFVMAMRSVAGGGGLQLTVPISNPNLSTSVGSAVQWDRNKALDMFGALKADDTEAIRPLAEAQEKQAQS